MGVFKWLRRERVTVTSHQISPAPPEVDVSQSVVQADTIRTDEYKRDLAEFQARRSSGANTTPVKKKCGRHSLPISCTDCSSDHDRTFNYEKKSAAKYKKHKRARSNTPEKIYEGLPNIQFLFQNQVFMPGGVYTTSYSEPKKRQTYDKCRSPEFLVQRHIDFKEEQVDPPPEFFKDNSLPFKVAETEGILLEGSGSEEVDGRKSEESQSNKDEGDVKFWEVMSELKNLDQWADEMLVKSPDAAKSDDSNVWSDTSAYGLPIASARNIDINTDRESIWNHGTWGVVPVQVKKLAGVTVQHVKDKLNTEINILRKCRHPNIILLMGIYPDINDNIHIICERCVDSLFSILHVQGRILSAQTAVQYALDISNALVFLRMQGFIHTELNSMSIMITSHDTAKLVDLGPCLKVNKDGNRLKTVEKGYEVYSPEPQYVNIEDTRDDKSDNEPLLSANPSETYLKCNAVAKSYDVCNNELYRWRAPELFTPDDGQVYPCSKGDVYSLALVLWESCNATIPWKHLTYDKLKEQYTLWKTGISLPNDGTYPGSLLSLLQQGLTLNREQRSDLDAFHDSLQRVKQHLDTMGYIIIPARLPSKKSFSTTTWEKSSTDSENSPKNIDHKHTKPTSSTESERSDPLYETIQKVSQLTYTKKDQKYDQLEKEYVSSACSTPIAKIKMRLDAETPGTFHRSDSTEYCSILSPNRTLNFAYDDSNKDQSSEKANAKLSRSFTPKSYKPLHITVPECNLDSIKPLIKDQNSSERSSYNFDIKNYSLPTTPIARSNKLRRNAWLSGEVTVNDRSGDTSQLRRSISKTPSKEDGLLIQHSPESPETIIPKSSSSSPEFHRNMRNRSSSQERSVEPSPGSVDTFTGLKRIDQPELPDERTTNTQRSSIEHHKSEYNTRSKIESELLANMNVKPLVAIHERWIYEANRKTTRSMSLPEDNRSQISAVKPASHCVDTLQKSLPQLTLKKPSKTFRVPTSPVHNGIHWDHFSQARDAIARSINFPPREHNLWKRDVHVGTTIENKAEEKTDQSTDTKGIEDFIRELIRKEFQHLLQEISDDTPKKQEILNKGVANVIESLQEDDKSKKESLKSFSRVKINGNNKPLLQITFSRSGENSLQVLDNCVNVTICDSPQSKLNVSMEDTLTEDMQANALKRCQAFNAIQEARSTEDLYIDDDLSTQMQENFGGRVKLIPLHGSLHEILCEKEDECCLIKVKQENGCDTIYFRCDNSDTESRDAIDGCELSQDTVVFKRSISLVEERIQRLKPKDKRTVKQKVRPKSEVFAPIRRETRVLSNSSPSLTSDKDEVEVNIESVMCYQDSSSDECVKCHGSECVKAKCVSECSCQDSEFELLEKKIEEDIASSMTLGCGCLEKISEENLSVINDDLKE